MYSSSQDSSGTKNPFLPTCFLGRCCWRQAGGSQSVSNERVAYVMGSHPVQATRTSLGVREPEFQSSVPRSTALGPVPLSKSPTLSPVFPHVTLMGGGECSSSHFPLRGPQECLQHQEPCGNLSDILSFLTPSHSLSPPDANFPMVLHRVVAPICLSNVFRLI